MPHRETSAEINQAAASWATRIDDVALGEAEQAAFDAWIAADVRRLGAFARAQAVLVQVKRAKALGREFDPASFHPGDGAIEELVADAPAETAVLTRRRMLIGSAAVAAGGAFAFFLPTERAAARIYATGRGETRLVPLADGSTITLNTDSRIAVTIHGARRTARLIEGEALFKVAAGRAPFLVEAGDISVRAARAMFALCRIEARPLQIRVCEGDVRLARGAADGHVLRANREAILAADGRLIERAVTPEALQRALAWQEGMLSFEDMPLRQAAAEFARYSERRIAIADPRVAAETVTGRYAANDPEGFARAVALSLDLHMQATPGGIVLAR